MRIVLTVHQFLPDHASGTEILTLHTGQELARRGHEVEIFTGYPSKVHLADEARFDSYEYAGLRVHRFLHQHVPMGTQQNIVEMEYKNALFAAHFRRFLKNNPQDMVHVFHFARLSALVIDECVEADIPCVFTPTDFWSVCPLIQLRLSDGSLCEGPATFGTNCVRHVAEVSQSPQVVSRLHVLPNAALAAGVIAVQNELLPEQWFSQFVRALSTRPEFVRQRLNGMDRIFAPTHLMQKLLTRNGVHPSRITRMAYGVDLSHVQRNIDRGRETRLRIGFIGTLVEYKGPQILIQAIRSLATKLPISLAIYGNMKEFPAFTQHLQSLAQNDSRIAFMGTFPNEQIGDVFNSLDCLVVPSIWYENTPLVIYSAMAAGCPVIATNLGGMSEAVDHHVNGLLFEIGNVEQLAAHIQTLALDRDTLRDFSSRTRMPKSIPQYVDELEQNYSDILTSRGTAGGGVHQGETVSNDGTQPLKRTLP